MKSHSILFAALIGITLVSVPALADEQAIDVKPVVTETFHATTYFNGGFGKGEEEFMRRAAHDFFRT